MRRFLIRFLLQFLDQFLFQFSFQFLVQLSSRFQIHNFQFQIQKSLLKSILFLFNFFIALCLTLQSAQANIVGNPTQNFNPSYSGTDFISVHSSQTIKKRQFNLGLYFDYASETLPIYLPNANGNLGDKLFFSHLGLGYGISDRWDVGLSIPSILGQNVDNSVLRGQYANTGLLEIRALSKYRISKFENGGGVAFIGSLGLNRTDNLPYLGDGPGPSINLELAMDKIFGSWLLGMNLGYRMLNSGDQIAGFTVFEPLGNSFLFSFAGNYKMNEKWSAIGELWAALPNADLSATDRNENSYEILLGGRYNQSRSNEDAYNINFGFTRELNHGIATPAFRFFAGVNYTFASLFGKTKNMSVAGVERPIVVDKTKSEVSEELPEEPEEESNYNEGYRQGYMAGHGIGPHAGLGPQHGDSLDGGVDFPEGYNDGYIDGSGPYPGDQSRQMWAKCYRTGFQGKLGVGPGAGKGPEHGEKLTPNTDCPDGFRTGWNDAPGKEDAVQEETSADSFYNPGYREGYKAGYGIGPHAGLGPDHGQTLDGGWEFPEGFYDGYIDASGPFPGDPDRRLYAQAYRTGFQGKLGVGPGKGTNQNYGTKINSKDDFPEGYEHGWTDAPDANEEITAPSDVNLPVEENANVNYDSDIQTIVIDTDEDILANRRPEEEEKLQVQNISFNTNSAVITPASNKVLQNIVNYIKKHEFKTLEIWGHTDSRGAALYNEKLSLDRANSVFNYLVANGVEGQKIKFDGWGERKPVAPNLSPEELRKNRRVEFIIRR